MRFRKLPDHQKKEQRSETNERFVTTEKFTRLIEKYLI